MIILHHAPFSVSSQSVRMTLAEKNLIWEDRLIDLLAGEQLRADFLALNPHGEVPILQHDSAVLCESAAINEYLNEVYPEVPLVPTDPRARHCMRSAIDRMQATVHAAAGVLTYAVLARPMLQDVSPDILAQLFACMTEARVQAWRHDVLAQGLQSAEVRVALKQYRVFFQGMERQLTTQHSWLAGGRISLADITALPYVMRADHMGMGAMFPIEEYPNLRSWYMRMSSRPSIQVSLLRYVDEASQSLLMKLAVQAQAELVPLMQA